MRLIDADKIIDSLKKMPDAQRTNKRVWYGRSFKGYGQHSPQRFPERRKQKWMDDYF